MYPGIRFIALFAGRWYGWSYCAQRSRQILNAYKEVRSRAKAEEEPALAKYVEEHD
jgi:hypothetical protein